MVQEILRAYITLIVQVKNSEEIYAYPTHYYITIANLCMAHFHTRILLKHTGRYDPCG